MLLSSPALRRILMTSDYGLSVLITHHQNPPQSWTVIGLGQLTDKFVIRNVSTFSLHVL